MRMGNHNEEHPGTPQNNPAEENECKIEDDVVVMNPDFSFCEDHFRLH